jgi:hypothetical protein
MAEGMGLKVALAIKIKVETMADRIQEVLNRRWINSRVNSV